MCLWRECSMKFKKRVKGDSRVFGWAPGGQELPLNDTGKGAEAVAGVDNQSSVLNFWSLSCFIRHPMKMFGNTEGALNPEFRRVVRLEIKMWKSLAYKWHSKPWDSMMKFLNNKMLNIYNYVHKSIKVFGILQHCFFVASLQLFSSLCFTNNISYYFKMG